MKFKRQAICCQLLSIILSFSLLAQTRGNKQIARQKEAQSILHLTNDDVHDILKASIEDKLNNLQLINQIKTISFGNEQVRYLSTKNVRPKQLPQIAGIKLILLTTSEIRKRTVDSDSFGYLSIERFEQNNGKVVVTIVEKYERRAYVTSRGTTVEFQKIEDRWSHTKIGESRTDS